jgi:hypothetical protein
MPSELVKYSDNRALLRITSRAHEQRRTGGHPIRPSNSLAKVRGEFRCNSLIIEGLLLDSFHAFLLASSLAPRRWLSVFTTSQGRL